MTGGWIARVAAETNRGIRRTENQDVVLIDGWASGADDARHSAEITLDAAPRGIAVVDGMGGHRGGEFAAWVAAHVLARGLGAVADETSADALAQRANEIVSVAGSGIGLADMGAAFAALVLTNEGFGVLNIGDCRVYRLSEARAGLLTVDDSGPSRHDPSRQVLTQSLGGAEPRRLDAHWFASTWGAGVPQRFVLASDGLAVLPEADIARLANDTGASTAASVLVSATLAAGAPDNVSVIVVDVSPEAT